MNSMKDELRSALLTLDRPKVEALLDAARREGPPMQVLEELVVPVLEGLGEDWSAGSVALSQIYMSGRICEEIVAGMLPPAAPERRRQPRHAIVVLSDYHLLGKRIVLSVMRASGFDTLDYGRMEPDALVERVRAEGVKILLISVLMLPAALKVKAVRAALDAGGTPVRIVVGGAPFLFDAGLWREVGADAMGRNAADAVSIVRGWMEEIQR